MNRRALPPIRPSDLRDHADEARIVRVWDRLERDLPGRERSPSRTTSLFVALAAATLSAFAAGVWIGSHASSDSGATAIRAVQPESSTQTDVLAAGTRQRSYPLPGGGLLTLSPGATVEIEHVASDAITLRLVRGEASLDTTGAGRGADMIAEDARVEARDGSVVSVRRNESDIDVRVSSGSARLSSPAGSRELASGERVEAVPMRAHAPITRADDPRPRPAPPLPRNIAPLPLPLQLPNEPPSVAVAAPDWRARYNAGELAQALDLLRQQPGGIDGAITQARSAAELAAISDIARAKGGEPAAALKALTQLVERFPSDPYAEIAAYTLGGMYEKMGQADQAQKYFERASSLKGVLAEDALCKQIRAEHRAGRKDEALRMSREYVNKYPDGRCKEDVDRILSGEEPAVEAPEPEASPDAGDASPP
jgi:hypothetical protein